MCTLNVLQPEYMLQNRIRNAMKDYKSYVTKFYAINEVQIMGRRDDYIYDNQPPKLQYAAVISVIIILVAVIFAGIYFFVRRDRDANSPGYNILNREETNHTDGDLEDSLNGEEMAGSDYSFQSTSESEDILEDPQNTANQLTTELGAEVDLVKILTAEGVAETAEQTIGIDVSKYQGNIDWVKVADTGIDFAMIRVGYRTMEKGEIIEDSSARYNLQEATANGIKVGAYFFSTAITESEAIEEAEWTADFISQYKITYPVAYNCEGFENAKSRQYNLTKEERTDFAKVFLNQIYDCGYTPMFYASKNELTNDSKWIASELEKSYKIWVSWYPEAPFPDTPDAEYAGLHAMWQYTNNGTIQGIDEPVDINVAYFGYEGENSAQSNTAPERVEADVEAGHQFKDVEETVTAKEATNLRNVPSQGDDSTVMLTLYNGQTAIRTGISSSGWSRVILNGETYYAVSSLLTTDLTVKTPEPAAPSVTDTPENTTSGDGIKTVFSPCDETVMPKMEVNLRTIPSVTDPDSIVVATAKFGETFKRTGINTDYGWSRVEYNGQTLYCVSSYIYVYELSEE